jgi:hypothetical protein
MEAIHRLIVTWDDDTTGEVNAWTGQCGLRAMFTSSRESAPPYHGFWVRASDVRRRQS